MSKRKGFQIRIWEMIIDIEGNLQEDLKLRLIKGFQELRPVIKNSEIRMEGQKIGMQL